MEQPVNLGMYEKETTLKARYASFTRFRTCLRQSLPALGACALIGSSPDANAADMPSFSQEIRQVLKQHMGANYLLEPAWMPDNFKFQGLTMGTSYSFSVRIDNTRHTPKPQTTYVLRFTGPSLQYAQENFQLVFYSMNEPNFIAKIELECNQDEKLLPIAQPAFHRYPLALCVRQRTFSNNPNQPAPQAPAYGVRLISTVRWFGGSGTVTNLRDLIEFVRTLHEV